MYVSLYNLCNYENIFFCLEKETILGCSRFVTSLLYGVLYRFNKNYHVFDGFTNSSHGVLLFKFQKQCNSVIFTWGLRKRRACALLCTDAEKGT